MVLRKGQLLIREFINNEVSNCIYQHLEEKGVKTHFVEQLNDRETLVKKLDIIPVEVVLRNVAAGSLCKRLGIKEGKEFNPPILEFFYKNDDLHDPLINDCHAVTFNWATQEELDILREYGYKINSLVVEFFKQRKSDW